MSQEHWTKQIPGWLVAAILLPFVACPLLRCWEVYHGNQSLSSPLHFWTVIVLFTSALAALLGYDCYRRHLRRRGVIPEANAGQPQTSPSADQPPADGLA